MDLLTTIEGFFIAFVLKDFYDLLIQNHIRRYLSKFKRLGIIIEDD